MHARRRSGLRLRSARHGLAAGLVALVAAALLIEVGPAVAAPGDPSNSTSATTTPTATATTTTATTSTATTTPTTTSSSTPSTTTSAPSTTTTSPPTTSSSPPPTSPPAPPTEPDPGFDPANPPPFSEIIEQAAPGQEALAEEALQLSASVVDTEDNLARLELEAEAAADMFRQAEAELALAEERAASAGKEAALAARQLTAARQAVGAFARNSYISGSTLATDLLILDADSPSQLIERAGLLEAVAASRLDVLATVEAAQVRSDSAENIADDALDTKTEAEAAAQAALDESTAMLTAQEEQLADLLEQKAELDAELYIALVELLGPEGAAAAFLAYEQEQLSQAAAEAAARAAAYGGGPVLRGEWALPLDGTFSSGYGERWGTMHWGIDIAAPMYTPLYAAGDGTIIQAGPATGFGQAVYLQHSNGDVTVYGHMEVIEVVAGQRVAAGQEIALVGSQGFSTGPHLHFEVHLGGINGTRVDPVIWLANRGIFV